MIDTRVEFHLRRRGGLALAAGVCAIVFALAPPARAEIAAKDVQVMARAIAFQENPPTGEAEIGVVVVADDPTSVKDVETVKAAFGGGIKVGALMVKPRFIPLAEIAGASGIAGMIVTGGAAATFAQVTTVGAEKKLLTIGSDLACLQAGACVMVVKSDPKIEITAGHAVAERNGVRFSSAFKMMIKEI